MEKFIAQYNELKTFVAEKPNDERTALGISLIAIINQFVMHVIKQYEKDGA
jgi:cell division protein FtsB